jgi:hypothetical protein
MGNGDRHGDSRLRPAPCASIRAAVKRLAGLAQLVERQFCKLDVAGSIPAAGTIFSGGPARVSQGRARRQVPPENRWPESAKAPSLLYSPLVESGWIFARRSQLTGLMTENVKIAETIDQIVRLLPSDKAEQLLDQMLAQARKMAAHIQADTAAGLLRGLPLFPERPDPKESSFAFFCRVYGDVIMAGSVFSDDLRRHDSRLYDALMVYQQAPGKTSCGFDPPTRPTGPERTPQEERCRQARRGGLTPARQRGLCLPGNAKTPRTASYIGRLTHLRFETFIPSKALERDWGIKPQSGCQEARPLFALSYRGPAATESVVRPSG